MPKIVQLGGVLRDVTIFGNILLGEAKKGTDIARNLGKNFIDKQIDRFNKEYITSSGITLNKQRNKRYYESN